MKEKIQTALVYEELARICRDTHEQATVATLLLAFVLATAKKEEVSWEKLSERAAESIKAALKDVQPLAEIVSKERAKKDGNLSTH